jgi:hypothetical protein
MKRVFRIDVLKCATCGAERLWIAAITNADTLAKILDHLELPSVASQPAPRPGGWRRPLSFTYPPCPPHEAVLETLRTSGPLSPTMGTNIEERRILNPGHTLAIQVHFVR